MMKKILCPVDFSKASMNGMEYAGNLAAKLMAHLTLLYVRPTIWPEAIQLDQKVSQGIDDINSRLQVLSEQCEQEFGVTCSAHIEQTTNTLEKAIAEQATQNDLIVMGTNGADNFYQFVFGSNSFHVMKQSSKPVLVVPDDCSFRPIRQIVYAFDPATNENFTVEQLKALAIPLNASIKVLHVVHGGTPEEREEKIALIKQEVLSHADKMISWSFESKLGADVAWSLGRYAADDATELLALSFHHRSLIDNIFRENVIKQLSMTASFPLFTFWR